MTQTLSAPPAQIIRHDAQALEVARELAQRFKLDAAQRDRDRTLPHAEMDAYSSAGLTAITVPKAYGGADVSFETLTDVFRIISAADPCIGQIPQTHFGAVNSLRTIGSEAQKHEYFAKVLAGQRFGSATSERGTRHARDFKTRIRRSEDHWRLQGVKFYCTGALFSDWVQVLALDEAERLTRVFVPADAEGVTLHNDWTGFGQRTTASGTVTFDNVKVEDWQILPAHLLFDGKVTLQGPVAQIMQAAIDAGIAEAAFADAKAFVKTHSRPWIDSGKETAAEDPYIIAAFGNLSVRIAAANALLRRAARTLDQASATAITAQTAALASVAVAEAKVLTTQVALDASEKLFELCGTSATSSKYDLDRHWRNARTHTLHDPVRWKYKLIGNYWLNGVHPDRHSFV
ncbi:sulfur acquisition oxidoreductase, SfnB family [Pseudomonas sp. URIL14HWK12:I8]|uniref:SfnB family sulfur acquisition oxidoreductase n=1 Tax=unclassified Pseudomonas TaxID=196821 RepID=UPI0004144B99|nr:MULTISPECIES: SfnB family sulfur acquisition oxidoreductase [unclassified Pseudomonas]SNB62863.1 sulfur acquisition oxidoreductase, SfnB family [Pseudomonas sp. URIL14HWK12:I8]